MNLLEINVFILWFQSEFWNDFVAMKLPFSRINEERKCHNFITTRSVCLAGKREGVHFVPNPFDWGQKWDLRSDLQWIPHWTHLFGAFGRLPPSHPSTNRWFGVLVLWETGVKFGRFAWDLMLWETGVKFEKFPWDCCFNCLLWWKLRKFFGSGSCAVTEKSFGAFQGYVIFLGNVILSC